MSFPTAVGLSLDDYYDDGAGDDDTFGFFQTGFTFAMPLGFIPPSAGSWQASAGVQFLWLGNNAAALNEHVNDHFEVIFHGGVSVTF